MTPAPSPEQNKHTPAPWVVGRAGEVYSKPRYESVCIVLQTVPQGAANAALISAAPELLEALKLLLEAGDHEWPAARAAIAKAEGRQ